MVFRAWEGGAPLAFDQGVGAFVTGDAEVDFHRVILKFAGGLIHQGRAVGRELVNG